MKILLISDVFPPDYQTSVGTITFNLAMAFKNKGHQILVITSAKNKKDVGKISYKGLDVWRVYASFPSYLRPYLSLYNPQSVNIVKGIINQFLPNIVHIHLVHYLLSYHCLKLAKRSGAKVFLTAHDVNLFHYGKFTSFIDDNDFSIPNKFNYRISWWQELKDTKKGFNPLRRVAIKYYLRYVDKIFSVSNILAEALASNGISNVDTIYNGVEISDYQANDDEIKKFKAKYNLNGKKIIFFGGRLSRSKGGEQLISALSLIIKEIPNVILLIAANQSGNWGRMNKLIKKLNLEKQVIVTSWLSASKMAIAYHFIDVCVTPSICLDTFNLFNIEAMAAKKPVVGTCFGGTPEIVIDNQTGYIVNPQNIRVMAEKIVDLLQDQEKSQKFGEAGYSRVREMFSADMQVKETLKYYNEFLQKNGKS